MYCIWICIKWFVLTYIYGYHIIIVFEIIIVQETTSCVIICLTCWNFSNFMMYCHTTFNWLIKNVFSITHNILFFYFYFWKIISCVYFSIFLCSYNKIKSLFIPWKLVSIKKFKYWLCICVHIWYLFQLIVLLKPDFNCCNSYALFWVDKVTTET